MASFPETYKEDKCFQYQPCLTLKRLIRNKPDLYRVLNSCKILEICAVIYRPGKSLENRDKVWKKW